MTQHDATTHGHGPDDELEDHDLGLSHDLPTLLNRRRALGLLSATGLAAALAACGSGSDSTATGTSAASTSGSDSAPAASSSAASDSTTEQIPEETGGPYPGDGSNGVNVLTESGIVRSDITASFGTASGVAEGVPLTLTLKVLDTGNGSAPLSGAAVYVWHCDRDGNYSMYAQAAADENYLRGVQETASDGTVTFTTIYPAAYDGRWPHVHFEVYPSLKDATSASDKLRTSQLAFPKDACEKVYATAGYEQSVANLARTSLSRDMVFSDGYSLQLAKVGGSVDGGMTATLNVPV
jgi:protocatechuate 3,4-dioxygenase beta subunit